MPIDASGYSIDVQCDGAVCRERRPLGYMVKRGGFAGETRSACFKTARAEGWHFTLNGSVAVSSDGNMGVLVYCSRCWKAPK